MADVFNKNPNAYIDLNNLFPVLNDKVGLTSVQWQKAIENANYLYNHLGLADVEVGTVQTVFTAPATLSDVEVSHREVVIDGKTIDYFDFVFYIPSPKIETSVKTSFVENAEDVNVELNQTPIYGTGVNSNVIVGYKFDFNYKLLDAKGGEVSSVNGLTGDVEITADSINALKKSSNERSQSFFSSINIEHNYSTNDAIGEGTVDFNFQYQAQGSSTISRLALSKDGFIFEKNGSRVKPNVNGETIATIEDIENAIGNVSTILGNTDDLEV